MLSSPRFLLCLSLFVVSAFSASAADLASPLPNAVQIQRAEKITAALKLDDPAKAVRVRDLIARQYADLSVIHSARDAAIKAGKEKGATDKTAGMEAIKTARDNATAAQDKLHPEYLARLATELTPAQIDQVKDGMTYGVLPITFHAYQEMLPTLTDDQKSQIFAWLTEAREHAIDASTSEEKHAWFGKYKGRINNYLSKAGIDMKQAEKEMLERQKPAKTN
ncbi:MAG TPA: DUF3826 domain-containing protein [Lacunisphaera sp.]|jgi:hypothetical protein